MRLIDADALMEKYHKTTVWDSWVEINNAPTVDAVPVVHGRWEEYIEFSDGQIGSYCSECHHGATYFPQRPDRYCRGCGARMDKA